MCRGMEAETILSGLNCYRVMKTMGVMKKPEADKFGKYFILQKTREMQLV